MNKTAIIVRPMLYKEARGIVDRINASINNVRVLILELYEGEGWTALGYESWRECVTAEFKNSQAYLYRQLEAAQTEKVISPMGEKLEIPERQLRPLTKLKDNPEQQREAWQKAVETAPEGKVTAAHVSKVVKEITGQQEPPKPQKQPEPPMPQKPEYAAYFVSLAISQLERIPDNDPAIEDEFNRLQEWIINKLKKGMK